MDCKTARQIIDFVRPRAKELDANETKAFHDHLGECPVCLSVAETEWEMEDHFGRAIRAVPLPRELRQRLLVWLRDDRRKWYRRYVWAPTTAAAVVLLAVGVAWYVSHHRPEGDMVAVLEHVSSAHDVERWFRTTHGMTVVAPPQFDYERLAEQMLAEFRGKPVPMLRFTWGDDIARVYILSRDQFSRNEEPSAVPGFASVVLEHPSDSQFVYVVYYSGGHLERFLDNQGRHAV